MQFSSAAAFVLALGLLSLGLHVIPAVAEPKEDKATGRSVKDDPCDERFLKKAKGLTAGPLPVLSGNSSRIVMSVVSFDGHRVPVTIHKPEEATSQHKVPVLLHSHGWSGTRSSGDGAFRAYHEGGFGVVSLDMRGHGDARPTSAARVHDVDFEIKDVMAVITFLGTLEWVVQESPGDPLIGALGGSYGGGYQLLTAALDPRLDAIAPDITWNDLPQSLVPNGAPKSAWVDLLYGSGVAFVNLDVTIHQGYAVLQSQNRIPDGRFPGEPDLKTRLTKSSPKSYSDAIRVPTLLTQGANDTLFGLNEALANYRMISRDCDNVYLVTHLGGHILNTNGTIPVPSPRPVGLQTPTGPSPCGRLAELHVTFYQRFLLGLPVDLESRTCMALDDGTVVRGASFPPADTTNLTLRRPLFQVISPSNTQAGMSDTTFRGPFVALGTPRIYGNVTTLGPDSIVYFSFRTNADATTINGQVTPFRIDHAASNEAFSVDLAALSVRVPPGELLTLMVSTVEDQFAHNSGRVPGTITFSDFRLDVPTIPA